MNAPRESWAARFFQIYSFGGGGFQPLKTPSPVRSVGFHQTTHDPLLTSRAALTKPPGTSFRAVLP